MTKEEISQLIKETVAHARNSFDETDSNLVGSIMEKMDSAIEVSVKKHINGTISEIKEIALQNKENIANYILADNLWKEKAEPILQMGKNLKGFGKVSAIIFAGIMGLSAIVGAFYGMIQWIRK